MPAIPKPAAVQDRIAQLLRDGYIVADVSRMCDVSTGYVITLAKQRGIDYVRCEPGMRRGKVPRGVYNVASAEEAARLEWRGKLANARWFGGVVR